MKKRLLISLCLIAVVLFSACSKEALQDAVDSGRTDGVASADEEYAYEQEANKLAEDTTFYNGYLGISYNE